MRLLLLVFGLYASSSWAACDPEIYSACKGDESHFTIVVDSVQTTLSKDRVRLTVEQLPSHQTAAIQNLSDKPLYLITDHPDDSLPFFLRDKKKWYVQAKYSDQPTSCVPRSATKKPVANLEKIDWDCAEQRGSCGDLFNPNVLQLPTESYPLGWTANGLLRTAIILPPTTEQKFTQYFLHDNKIEKVSMISTLMMNEDYLKVTCDHNGKIDSCGDNCRTYTSTSVAIKNPVTAAFNMASGQNDFSDVYDVELTVDGDFKDRINQAGAMLARHGVSELTDIIHYGRLDKRPFDYIVYRIARHSSEDVTNLVGQGWSFKLTKLPQKDGGSQDDTASVKTKLQRKRGPAASQQKSK